MTIVYLVALGAIVLVRLLDPIFRVGAYGFVSGLLIGLWVFIASDLFRLGRNRQSSRE